MNALRRAVWQRDRQAQKKTDCLATYMSVQFDSSIRRGYRRDNSHQQLGERSQPAKAYRTTDTRDGRADALAGRRIGRSI